MSEERAWSNKVDFCIFHTSVGTVTSESSWAIQSALVSSKPEAFCSSLRLCIPCKKKYSYVETLRMVNIHSVAMHIVLCFRVGNTFYFNNDKIPCSIHAAVTVTVSNANEGEASTAPSRITASLSVTSMSGRAGWCREFKNKTKQEKTYFLKWVVFL